MSDFIPHHNDPNHYYDLERVYDFILTSNPLTIILLQDAHATAVTITETFTDVAEQTKRLQNILSRSQST